LPSVPAARQAFSVALGISNGPWSSRALALGAAISSLPSGEPCTLAVPCLVGAPKPIVVLQAISEGLSDFARRAMARVDRAWSCPSTACTFQPQRP
jgi:hypothetical protein